MKKTTLQFTTHSPVETIKLGQRIGRILNGGQVIALVGNLGTG
ncbi:MAG: tRNA (adenosine(37)-N6)-threonylcarbamoyltransferase complex ATPase subunit type 1 TsaE, partial [Planctomycetes bacterium]|nr:tRNA (adenosine(37)-N6)-threonylcarbamoyltransferase complex ATPase subunit type 1 TsaE [Planctomycetota bacterium]